MPLPMNPDGTLDRQRTFDNAVATTVERQQPTQAPPDHVMARALGVNNADDLSFLKGLQTVIDAAKTDEGDFITAFHTRASDFAALHDLAFATPQ